MRLSLALICATVLFFSVFPALAQCPGSLAPLDDQTGIEPKLLFYEIAPGAHIVLYNTTGADIPLTGSPYWLCSPFVYVDLSTLGSGVTVPAYGYATVPWPVGFTDTAAGGELQLYKSASFFTSTDIVDFVCWGTNPHFSRKGQAELVGKWTGACVPTLTNGAIRRRPATTGKVANSYDRLAVPTVVNCTPECAPNLGPVDDGTGIAANLILSEIRPGSFIELYNTTGAPIALSGVTHQLCSPFSYVALSILGPTTVVPAEGFALVAWPTSFTDTAAGGEIQLYADNDFLNSNKILDFVCWGSNPHASRKGQAESVGKWAGACAAVLGDGSIHRKPGTNGTTATSYDVTAAASPNHCPASGATPAPQPIPRIPLVSGLKASPNPFNPVTQIQFELRTAAAVRVNIYRADGSFVATAFEGSLRAGERSIAWNGSDEHGERLPSGVYLFQVEADGEKFAGKMVLVE